MNELLLKEIRAKASTFKLKRCRCNILFDVTTEGFRVHDKINNHRTHLVNPKSNQFYRKCERCRTKQQEYKQRPEVRERTQEYQKEYRQRPEVQERLRELSKEYKQRPEVKTRIQEYGQEYKEKNRDRAREINRIYLSVPENKERHKANQKTERYKERKRKYNNEYNKRPEVRERRNETQRKEYQNNTAKRLRRNLSLAMNHKLKTVLNGGCLKGKNTLEYLGCSMEEFVQHIENQFEDGMCWDNYGRSTTKCIRCWHLDHIVPAMYKESADDIITVDVIIERSHYTNFQPMWADENISKSNRYIGKHCV